MSIGWAVPQHTPPPWTACGSDLAATAATASQAASLTALVVCSRSVSASDRTCGTALAQALGIAPDTIPWLSLFSLLGLGLGVAIASQESIMEPRVRVRVGSGLAVASEESLIEPRVRVRVRLVLGVAIASDESLIEPFWPSLLVHIPAAMWHPRAWICG